MKNLIFAFILIFCVLKIYAQPGRTTPLIIDHNCVNKFNSIPDSILPDIIKLKLMYRHASVGTTINNGLDCIQGTRTNPAECKLFTPYKYDRRNWEFQGRGNSGWYGKIDDFVNEVQLQKDSFDIFSFKYCYLDGLDQVAEPCGGSKFNPTLVQKAWDSLRLNFERLENKYPDKIFVMWTIPLTQPGQHCTDTLNYLMREYTLQNNKILFDIADIQCHDTLNQRLTNSSGWEMAFSGYCGEKPPGPSCHPNWAGSIMLAKAFWWMMYNISGNIGPLPDTIPTLTTSPVSNITFQSATSGGNITDDGGQNVTARGVVWDTSKNPYISLSTKTTDGSGKGTFISNISGLNPNTTYYLRAYATNSIGTAYGNEISFTTLVSNFESAENQIIKIYPNPSSGKFFIEIPSPCLEITISDIQGKVLQHFIKPNTSGLECIIKEAGIYTVHIETTNSIIIKKTIVFK